MAFGDDDRALELGDDVKSISSENTFLCDTDDRPTLRACLKEQADEIAGKLARRRLAAHTVQVKVRYSDFTTITRQLIMDPPTQDEIAIFNQTLSLLRAEKIGKKKIRLIGISASGLVPPCLQLDLFDASIEKKQRLASAVDAIRTRHGASSIRRTI